MYGFHFFYPIFGKFLKYLKNKIKYILHRIFGYQKFLFLFSIFKIRTIRTDKRENDFFMFLDMLKNEGVFLDIGANIGVMTYFLSQKNSDLGVFSFEPMPSNLDVIQKIIARYQLSNVNLMPIALGNENGDVEMVLPKVDEVNMHGLSHVVHHSITDFNEGDRFKVPIKRLDDLQELKGKKVTGIKIDVENFEYFVMLGASEILERDHPLVYAELWDNENREQCFELMKSLGYKILVVEGNKCQEFDVDTHIKQNFIFCYEA